MCPFVYSKSAWMGVCHITVFAFVEFFVCMNIYVRFEITFCDECLYADRAFEKSFIGMGFELNVEVSSEFKSLGAGFVGTAK